MKEYTYNNAEYDLETVDSEELRKLCIRKEWFTCGTTEAYEKLFKLNEMGKSIETLATVIWTASDTADLEEIIEELKDLNRWEIYIESVKRALANEHFGETEIEIITEALKTHQDAGKAYKIIEG